MIDRDGRKVVASRHAMEQAAVRCAILKGADREGVRLWLERSVSRALRDGRMAKRLPRWCVRSKITDGPRAKIGQRWGGEARFVWNEDESAVFVVQFTHEKSHPSGHRVWLILTVLTPERPSRRRPEPEAVRRPDRTS